MEHAIKQNNAVDIYENYFETESENVAVRQLRHPCCTTFHAFPSPIPPHVRRAMYSTGAHAD